MSQQPNQQNPLNKSKSKVPSVGEILKLVEESKLEEAELSLKLLNQKLSEDQRKQPTTPKQSSTSKKEGSYNSIISSKSYQFVDTYSPLPNVNPIRKGKQYSIIYFP
jgi:hypothetical protein